MNRPSQPSLTGVELFFLANERRLFTGMSFLEEVVGTRVVLVNLVGHLVVSVRLLLAKEESCFALSIVVGKF